MVISSLDFASSVGHYRKVTPSFLACPPRNPSKTNFDFKLWEKMDSNHRRYKPADLQSAPFGHSGILPFFSFLFGEIPQKQTSKVLFLRTFEPMEGIEPTTPRLQITCSGQLSYIGILVVSRQAPLKRIAKIDINFLSPKLFHLFCRLYRKIPA